MASLRFHCNNAARRNMARVLAMVLFTAAVCFFVYNFGSPSDVRSPFSPIDSSEEFVHEIREGSRSNLEKMVEDIVGSCDFYDGRWVYDEHAVPLYEPGSCPFVGDSFNCFKNGLPDSEFLKYRWKPHGCQLPRFDGLKMLKMLTGKRLVFVGDSLNRNMWQSLICALTGSLHDQSRVKQVFPAQGFFSFQFEDYDVSIDFVKSPFLVQEFKTEDNKEVLKLDTMDKSSSYYQDADILIFNTGHWWTHAKVKSGEDYFMEGETVHKTLEVNEAYTRALKTWSRWVDSKVDPKRTKILFRGYSASHFKGGQWNSGGSCSGETEPITDEAFLSPYPPLIMNLESVIADTKTPVVYMNVTKMTDFRKDGHPSIYREVSGTTQDCSHWCLPGIPNTWNQILYATILGSYYPSSASFR